MEHPISVAYLRWIVLLPLIGAAINGLGGYFIQRSFGKRAICFIGCAPVIGAFILAVRVFVQLHRAAAGKPLPARSVCGPWIDVGGLQRRHRVLARSAVDGDDR